MQANLGTMWVGSLHLQNPETDGSDLIRGNTHFKQLRLFMFSAVFFTGLAHNLRLSVCRDLKRVWLYLGRL